ncbi:hypothetical protein L3556_07485 [Candidatus Synechococcus calcipolaris G9]|uniref:SbsA Ig-like domain-containing protein n=1 Tax=Candidatus Synechococcus calcipolaris G9 TaxID=1497997 RepID=A0ABT6EZ13_9SYNE|nr:hypothetical protein [Candidatus Synechococcus calcipolaris]MDG2990771.1 hypothetical protein [Candidatus Synechococcus calcipolaris G9]
MYSLRRSPSRTFPQPLDRAALSVLAIAFVLTLLLLWGGDQTLPQVREFSWQDRQVGAEDKAFILSFNRQMDWPSVQENLVIDPPLPGKVSWSGRRLAYTLLQPIPYGQAFQLKLEGATSNTNPTDMQPFQGQFRSRDRALVYLGTGVEEGRLILNNLTLQKKIFLTPPELRVFDFQPYPAGDRILFSATDRDNGNGFDPQLYTASTGLYFNAPEQPKGSPIEPGQIELILDNRDFQILKFDLSADGQTIVVQRVNRQNLNETSLWALNRRYQPRRLDQVAAGDFQIAPDNETLVIAQGQGIALSPLDGQQTTTSQLDFLPQFGMVLGFSRDGRTAALVRFNPDFSRSLFLVNNQGVSRELLQTNGSLLTAAFDPLGKFLYCVLTELTEDQDYREQPYLVLIDLEDGSVTRLLEFNQYQEIQISLAPDGSAIAFDRSQASPLEQQGSQEFSPTSAPEDYLDGDLEELAIEPPRDDMTDWFLENPYLENQSYSPESPAAEPYTLTNAMLPVLANEESELQKLERDSTELAVPEPSQQDIWLLPLDYNPETDVLTIKSPELVAPGLHARWLP